MTPETEFLAAITYEVRPDHATTQYHRLRVLRMQTDILWNAFIDIGIIFYQNVPLTIMSSQFDDSFIIKTGPDLSSDEDVRDLRLTYDPAYSFGDTVESLMDFHDFREMFESAEKSLHEGDIPKARAVLFRCDTELQGDLRPWIGKLEEWYEATIAAMNALADVGRLAARDPWAIQRMSAFEAWSEFVKNFTEMTPEEVWTWYHSPR